MWDQKAVRNGHLPLVGVNTFLPKEHAGDIVTAIELIRSRAVREEGRELGWGEGAPKA